MYFMLFMKIKLYPQETSTIYDNIIGVGIGSEFKWRNEVDDAHELGKFETIMMNGEAAERRQEERGMTE